MKVTIYVEKSTLIIQDSEFLNTKESGRTFDIENVEVRFGEAVPIQIKPSNKCWEIHFPNK